MKDQEVVLPFPLETTWDILQHPKNHSDKYVVNVKESLKNLNPKQLGTYLNNILLRIRVDTSGLDYETKVAVFESWLYGYNMAFVEEFTETVISLVLAFKGFDTDSHSIMNKEETERYLSENHDKVERWIVFYDSILVYVLKQYYGHKAIDTDPKTEFVNINEPNYTPVNLVHAFEYQDFTYYYSLLDGEHFAYLVNEFDTPYFAGKQLYDFVYNPNNPIAGFTSISMLDSLGQS